MITLQELESNYILGDGAIRQINIGLDFPIVENKNGSNVTICLSIRKRTSGKHFINQDIQILFKQLKEIRLFEDFLGGESYSDVVFKRTEAGDYYLSLDPYGNSGEPHQNDNLVVIAKEVTITELQ